MEAAQGTKPAQNALGIDDQDFRELVDFFAQLRQWKREAIAAGVWVERRPSRHLRTVSVLKGERE